MKLNFLRLSLVIFLSPALHLSCSSPSASLLSTMGESPQFSGISLLLKNAGGLSKILGKKKGPFTFIAPTNKALSKLGAGTLEKLLKPENKEMLAGILKKHVIHGKFTPEQIMSGELKDVLGNPVNLGNIHITESIPTQGGIIQVIDGVIQ